MTFVVPFDGSDLAKTALVRAVEFASVLEERVLAVCVIPEDNATYARDHGWIGSDEPFDRDAVVSSVHQTVTELAPTVEFRYELVGRRATRGTIAGRLRKVAREVDASMVFIGSENAGRLVSSLSSVGRTVAADDEYDVVIVRNRKPSKIERIAESSPVKPKSDFYR